MHPSRIDVIRLDSVPYARNRDDLEASPYGEGEMKKEKSLATKSALSGWSAETPARLVRK
jgi:hypothetical protein